jgi:hypothetical protein
MEDAYGNSKGKKYLEMKAYSIRKSMSTTNGQLIETKNLKGNLQ